MKGVGCVKGYGKGRCGRSLRGEATEMEWLGDTPVEGKSEDL
jgi:hypothetical protein